MATIRMSQGLAGTLSRSMVAARAGALTALCNEIDRAMPHRKKVPPDFAVIFDYLYKKYIAPVLPLRDKLPQWLQPHNGWNARTLSVSNGSRYSNTYNIEKPPGFLLPVPACAITLDEGDMQMVRDAMALIQNDEYRHPPHMKIVQPYQTGLTGLRDRLRYMLQEFPSTSAAYHGSRLFREWVEAQAADGNHHYMDSVGPNRAKALTESQAYRVRLCEHTDNELLVTWNMINEAARHAIADYQSYHAPSMDLSGPCDIPSRIVEPLQ